MLTFLNTLLLLLWLDLGVLYQPQHFGNQNAGLLSSLTEFFN